jgi:hypothetical protein
MTTIIPLYLPEEFQETVEGSNGEVNELADKISDVLSGVLLAHGFLGILIAMTHVVEEFPEEIRDDVVESVLRTLLLNTNREKVKISEETIN